MKKSKAVEFLKQFNESLVQEIPRRVLGKTGVSVSILGLGGQGALESHGDAKNCVKIIRKALELGVTYFDTSPIYDDSELYYGEALRGDRKKIFLATKTDDRTRDGSLRTLDRSLKRLKTDHIDLWQIHHLESMKDAAEAVRKGGALDALREMQKQGVVRFIGITGHDHPDALLYAMLKADFDVVLCPVNACERNMKPSFIDTVVPRANEREMGIVGMKVFAQGHIFKGGGLSTEEALIYAMSHKVSTVIAGMDSVQQLEECVSIAKKFSIAKAAILRAIEAKTKDHVKYGCFYRRENGGYGSQEDLTTVSAEE